MGPTLVFGSSGFLGAHVLSAAGAEAVGAPRGSGELERVLGELRPSRIVNCAALSSVADAEARPAEAREANVELPRALARWCVRSGARLVHVSTDLVFGAEPPPRSSGFREEDAPAPVSEYGRSKAAGERAVLETDPRALVVRLPLLTGDSQGRGRGASDSLLAAIGRGERPALFADEWRTPLDVADAARALVELARGDARGLLHVAGPDRLSRHELGLLVLRAHGLAEDLVRTSRRPPERPPDVSLDSGRARELLATPLRSFRA